MLYKAFATMLSAGALALSAAALASPASEEASETATGLQSMVGKKDGVLTITGIRADGETLVLLVDGPKGWRANKTATELSDAFVSGFCESGSNISADGMKIRVETTEDGGNAKMTGPNVDHCPAG